VSAALELRARLVGPGTTAYRLINGEGDHLPGFLVDRYGDVLVLQSLTAGGERLKPILVEALIELVGPRAIVERSEGSVREAEGLDAAVGVLHGEPPEELTVSENGLAFLVTAGGGQKTGHFCDQRPNRLLCRGLSAGRRVLDAFAYSGGFAVHAGSGGAKLVSVVESSPHALALAQRNWDANGLPGERAEFVQADVGRFLRQTRDSFDLLVLDPPALVRQRRDVARGARAYKDLHLWAFRRAAEGALVLTFTCSQHVSAELFRKIVLGAAVDARREAQILSHLGPGPDHPVALGHPEGEYLSGLLLRVA
jgi:23S rRNA (cytosine1962-C5)-methyltransferase